MSASGYAPLVAPIGSFFGGMLWSIGIACGLSGLVGGYLGALAQPHVPEKALRLLLGGLAISIGCLYLVQGLT
jgi:uncharacterized membrane protein YfcA